MTLAQVHGVVLSGMGGIPVTVEVDVSAGLPAVGLVGLADAAIGEARQRARCAVENSGLKWPMGRITIGLSPAHLRKHGTGLDLPIAIGVLAGYEQIAIPDSREAPTVFVGELGLDGRVNPVPGAITLTCAAQSAGFSTIVLPAHQVAECARVPGIEVIGVESLVQAVHVLVGTAAGVIAPAPDATTPTRSGPDLRDVRGQLPGRRCVEIAAAGRHSVAMVGPPGVGKTLLAERLPGLLPDLEESDAVDVMAIHALCSAQRPIPGEDRRPPFQSPHHSASPAALLGSVHAGSVRPGALSLAHRGVLFMDEAPEFARNVLEALRQPIESGAVSLHRAGWTGEVPADFQLVLAANPCPCGLRGTALNPQRICSCSEVTVRNYAQRISGPLLDRIDLRVQLRPVRVSTPGEESAIVAERVQAARERAAHRWRVPNGQITPASIAEHAMEPRAQDLLDAHLRTSGAVRSTHRIAKVAWTISDLAEHARPNVDDVDEAIEWHQPLWQVGA